MTEYFSLSEGGSGQNNSNEESAANYEIIDKQSCDRFGFASESAAVSKNAFRFGVNDS
jgi:hypothetical protein